MAKTITITEKKVTGVLATILKNPRITEKAANANAQHCYVFDVAVNAVKSEVGKAFFAKYAIKPVKVNVVTIHPKQVYRKATNKTGFKNSGKKAYVFIPKGKTIEII